MYRFMPVSVFDVEGTGRKGIRGKSKQKESSRNAYSPFPLDVCEHIVQFYLRDKFVIFDPFAGWGERGAMCEKYEKVYLGYDISPTAIQYAKDHFGVNNLLGDSRVDDILPHDGLITCPPYFNLEKYDGEKNMSRIKTWAGFLNDYKKVWKRCVANAYPDATYCIVVADFRKEGTFYNLSFETQRIMKELGMECVDKVILSQKKKVCYRIMLPQCKRLCYSAKVHHYLLVFKKRI